MKYPTRYIGTIAPEPADKGLNTVLQGPLKDLVALAAMVGALVTMGAWMPEIGRLL